MSKKDVIRTALVSEYGMFGSTAIRWNALLSPIQKRSYKHSDFLHYIGRPVIDVISTPLFLFDAVVSAINCVVSLIATAQLWASGVSPRNSCSNTFASTEERWQSTKQSFCDAVSAVVAAVLNPVLSILALITRPVASLVIAVADLCADRGNYSFR